MRKLTKTEEKRLRDNLEKKKLEKGAGRKQTQAEIVRELLPIIEQYQADGLTIEDIRETLLESIDNFKVKKTTFRRLLQEAKKEVHGIKELPRGRGSQGRPLSEKIDEKED